MSSPSSRRDTRRYDSDPTPPAGKIADHLTKPVPGPEDHLVFKDECPVQGSMKQGRRIIIAPARTVDDNRKYPRNRARHAAAPVIAQGQSGVSHSGMERPPPPVAGSRRTPLIPIGGVTGTGTGRPYDVTSRLKCLCDILCNTVPFRIRRERGKRDPGTFKIRKIFKRLLPERTFLFYSTPGNRYRRHRPTDSMNPTLPEIPTGYAGMYGVPKRPCKNSPTGMRDGSRSTLSRAAPRDAIRSVARSRTNRMFTDRPSRASSRETSEKFSSTSYSRFFSPIIFTLPFSATGPAILARAISALLTPVWNDPPRKPAVGTTMTGTPAFVPQTDPDVVADRVHDAGREHKDQPQDRVRSPYQASGRGPLRRRISHRFPESPVDTSGGREIPVVVEACRMQEGKVVMRYTPAGRARPLSRRRHGWLPKAPP